MAISESDLAVIVEDILSERPKGEALYSELIPEIRKRATLGADDLAPSQTRHGEEMWEQRVRNITSHKNFRGRIVSIPGGLKLVGVKAA